MTKTEIKSELGSFRQKDCMKGAASCRANDTGPVVSVAMPVFNAQKYIDQAISAMTLQTYKNIEVVIVDNCSNDGTYETCLAWAKRDGRIKVFRNDTNIGAVANFERSQKLCSGKYFLWAAGDDLCSLDFIESLLVVMEADRKCVLVMSNIAKIADSGEFIGGEWLTCSRTARHSGITLPRRIFFSNPISNVFYCIYGMYRTAAFSGVSLRVYGMMRYATASEVPILAQVALRGSIVCVPRPVKMYRVHADSVYNTERSRKSIIRRIDNFMNVSQCVAYIIFFKAKMTDRFALTTSLLLSMLCYIMEWLLRKCGLVTPVLSTVNAHGRRARLRHRFQAQRHSSAR